jgi:hypothetical protein
MTAAAFGEAFAARSAAAPDPAASPGSSRPAATAGPPAGARSTVPPDSGGLPVQAIQSTAAAVRRSARAAGRTIFLVTSRPPRNQ